MNPRAIKKNIFLTILSSSLMFSSVAISSEKEPDKEPTKEKMLGLFACARHIKETKIGGITTTKEHCFVKATDPVSHSVIDSRGFFQEGSFQEPNPHEGTCANLGSISEKQWQEITQVYDKHEAKDYSVLRNNCCSVTKEALEKVNLPTDFINKLNCGIGTGGFPSRWSK